MAKYDDTLDEPTGGSALPLPDSYRDLMADYLAKISTTQAKKTKTATDKINLDVWNKAYNDLNDKYKKGELKTTPFTGGGSGGTGGASGSNNNNSSVTKTYTSSDGKVFDTEAAMIQWEMYLKNQAAQKEAARLAEEAKKAQEQANRQSAWDLLKTQFDLYGLGSLVDGIKGLIKENVSPGEFTLRLRQTDAYKQRFAANDARVKAGMKALDEASYLALEDSYANLMRKYGLPSWYTEQGVNGRQGNLEQFIANDVSPVELEDRIQLAVNRVNNGPKEVLDTLKKFYPNVSQGDVYAYLLDPKKALPQLQRQVTAAEVGAEAVRNKLDTSLSRADELAGLGIDQRAARQGYQTIGAGLERGKALAGLYGENYDQNAAEQEVFGMNDAVAASRKRKKIAGLEQATFGGSTGITGGALDQNRAGGF